MHRGNAAICFLIVLLLLGCAYFAFQSDPLTAHAAPNGTQQSIIDGQREAVQQYNSLLQERFQEHHVDAVGKATGESSKDSGSGDDGGGGPLPGSKFPLQGASTVLMPDFKGYSNLSPSAPGNRYYEAGAPGLGAVLPDAHFAASGMISAREQVSWQRMATSVINGLAAGDQGQALGVEGLGLWTSSSLGWISNTRPSTKYHGNLFTLMGGVDYLLLDNRLLLGMAAGWEHLYLNTDFNDGRTYSNALSLLPYASFAITPTTFFDVSFGLSLPHYEIKGRDTVNNRDLTGDYDATRTVVSTNITQYFYVEDWMFNAKLGNIYSNEYQPAYTDSGGNRIDSTNTYIGELQTGAQVGYNFGSFSPYLGATFLWDYALRNASEVDQTEMLGSLGINFQATESLLLTLDLSNSFFRDDSYSTTGTFSLRYQF